MENIAYIDEVDDDQMIHYDLIHIDTSAMDNLDDKNKSARTVVNGGDCDITDEERYRIKSNYSIGAILTFDNPGFVSDHIENFQDISNAAPGIVMEQKDVRITLRPLDLLNQGTYSNIIIYIMNVLQDNCETFTFHRSMSLKIIFHKSQSM